MELRARLAVGALVLIAVGAGSLRASADPYLDQANQVPCPPGPPGWVNPPANQGGKNVLTPLTAVTAPDGLTEYSAAPVVQITCNYRTESGKYLDVSVRYALPIDINPWNDFDIGCTDVTKPEAVSTAPEAWSNSTRIYRVVGAKSWSLATFIDNLGQLTAADVPRFEAMADELLKAAQPLAHNCSLVGHGAPVGVTSTWTFSFDAHVTNGGVTSSGSGNGSFVTTASTEGSQAGAIKDLVAENFHVELKHGGKTHSLSIKVGAPIAFAHSYGSTLRTKVVVLTSGDPECKAGSAGTLLLSVPYLATPTIKLDVCGHTYLDGKGSVSATIKSV